MPANAIRNSVSPLIENPILPLSLSVVLGLGSVFLDVDVGPGDSSALVLVLVFVSMTKGENIPPRHNEIGLWLWWNELGGNDSSPPNPDISDVGLEGDGPPKDVGLEADGTLNDVGLDGGGEEEGEAGGEDMFLRMAV